MKKIIVLNDINSLDRKIENSSEIQKNKDSSLEKVLNSMKHVVKSKEWEEMEGEIKNLTAKEKKEIYSFINEKIKPDLLELKSSIFNKEKRQEIIEKIKHKIMELEEKIK